MKLVLASLCGMALAMDAKEYTGKFDCHSYLARYPDLMNAFGSNCNRAYDHYVVSGMGEGRSAVYTGKNFDCQGYLTRYPDLKRAFRGDCTRAFNHYVNNGRHEGRDSSENDAQFKCETYLARHTDLMNAFGSNCEAAFAHYLQFHADNDGKETRKTADDNEVWHCESYLSKHRDLQKAFGHNCEAAFNHYVRHGRHEGRDAGQTGPKHFQCEGYLLRHADLRKAFGSDCVAAFSHYLSFGWKEGRDATSGLYDCNAYLDRYPDLKAAFGKDCDRAFKHYINNGEKAGRNPTKSLSNTVCAKPSLCATEHGSNAQNLLVAKENPANTMVLRQNGGNTEYQLNPYIQARTEYEMILWVAYTKDYNGQKNEFHFRFWEKNGKAHSIGKDSDDTLLGSGVEVVDTKVVDGLTWQKERRTFTTPASTNTQRKLAWYVGYPARNTKGYRYISGLEFNVLPRDCNGNWLQWGACSKTCGGGSQTSTFKVAQTAKWGGKACSVEDGEVKSRVCNADVECPEDVDVEMEINETVESFTEDKQQRLINEIAKQLGLRPEEVEIHVGQKPNKIQTRRLMSAGGLLITVTIKVLPSQAVEEVEKLESPTFSNAVTKATGIKPVFKQFKPSAGSLICATCKWDSVRGKIEVTHYINSQRNGEKGLQHKCYHNGSKCKCVCSK